MKEYRRMCVALFLGWAYCTVALAQPSHIFHHLTSKDGLSNSSVRDVLRDSYGFLWIGTASGLNRYDGYSFKTYMANPDDPNGLLNSNIFGLQEDRLGNIWVSSLTYSVYEREKDHFINDTPGLLKAYGMQVPATFKVHVDRNKDLWVLCPDKVYYYHMEERALKEYLYEQPWPNITSGEISEDQKYLYVAIQSGILLQIEKQSGRQEQVDLSGVSFERLSKVFVDSRNGIWLFSTGRNEVYYRKSIHSEWTKILLISGRNSEGARVNDALDDGNGRIWIGTDHHGVFVYDRSNASMMNITEDPYSKYAIASNNIICLYKDNQGTVWIGHGKRGISYYHDSFHHIVNMEHPECRDVSVIMEDRKGNVWLGTDGNGLFVKEHARSGALHKIPMGNIPIVSLLEDRRGRVWIGTFMQGLYLYENGRIQHFTRENSPLLTDDIWDLQEDRYENIWISTLAGGIQCLKKEATSMKELMSVGESIHFPVDMHYDGGDKMYIGTVYGLYVLDITTYSYVAVFGNQLGTQQFKDFLITGVYKDRRGDIWLAHTHGLTYWDMHTDSLHIYNKATGLSDNLVNGITGDDYGNVWVTTSNGLSILSVHKEGNEKVEVAARNFSTSDGFSDNFFNGGAMCKLRNGDMLLGSPEGYSIVNPVKLTERNRPPAKVIFTALSIGSTDIQVGTQYGERMLLSRPMEQTDSLVLRHDDRMISLTFTTADLLYSGKVTYAYQLEGFDHQWINTTDHKLEISSLPPGDYRLLVKASNSDGVWNHNPTLLHITITPPFYLSTWAYVLYNAALVGFLFLIRYWVKRRHRMKLEFQRLQMERDQKAHLNEMKLRFFTNISHDLRTPLTLITTPLQAILNGELEDGLRRKLQMMNRNAEQLLQLIGSLLDFRKLDVGAETLHLVPGDIVSFVRNVCESFRSYAVDRRMQFSVHSELNGLTMQFDPDKVRKIVLNLLSNAFKFTPNEGSIAVHLFKEGNQLCINFSDTGSGISNKDKQHIFEQFYQATHAPEITGSGIGLHIVSEYVRMHGGAISVEDNVPTGSIFKVKMPIVEINSTAKAPEAPEEDATLYEEAGHQVSAEAAPPVLLLVDDNQEFCKFMAESLSDAYRVLVANNGQDALSLLKTHDVNVVVSDVMMPVMSGTELCQQIKTNIEWSHIPVILLTARTAEESKMEGLTVGADDYITKPFNLNLLNLRIEKFLEWTKNSHISFSQKMDVSPSEITITSLDEKLIEKAIKVVEDHMSDSDFSVERLGEEVGLSRGHLYKKLMFITGKGPAEFIRTVRLKRGRQLLEKSQLQIAEIAYAVGFNSPKRFTINFKNEFGISPSEYLRERNHVNET